MKRANIKKLAGAAGMTAVAAGVVVTMGSGTADAKWGPWGPSNQTKDPATASATHTANICVNGAGCNKPTFSIPNILTGTITPGGVSTVKISSTSTAGSVTYTTVTTQTVATIAHLPSVQILPCVFARCSTSVSSSVG